MKPGDPEAIDRAAREIAAATAAPAEGVAAGLRELVKAYRPAPLDPAGAEEGGVPSHGFWASATRRTDRCVYHEPRGPLCLRTREEHR